jgi:predicted house-cleaning noncanonical NTP pyrophosphatase (MazG superfamily)
MEKFYHKKLIRDKIPEIIEADDGKYEVRVMEEDEFKKELRQKLIEEGEEVIKAEKSELGKELADVLELIKSIAESEDISFELVEEKQKQRREKRGGFKKKLFLVWSNKPSG